MKVKSYVGEYEVDFYSDFSFFEELKEKENKFFIIDKKVYGLYENVLKKVIENDPYYLMEAVEDNKNVEKALEIIANIVELKSKRNTLLVAVGGGIVQDISAFISNILYRGIQWILVPTTLLSQADSCIGSKSSLNFKGYKNLLGYFYPPTRICICSRFVYSLEERDYLSGCGEIMKCSIMDGYDSFRETEQNIEGLLERKEYIVLQEIKKTLTYKKAVIEADEFDKGYRNIMNFGHTFGHALESTSHYVVPHGQAVSVGILIANEISRQRGYASQERINIFNAAIKKIVSDNLVKKEFFSEEFLEAMKKDKKYTGGLYTCILFMDNGVKRFSDVSDDEILNAISCIFKGGML